MKKQIMIILILLITFNLFSKDNKIIVQLKWDHQFQFAGFYAAMWKGFYKQYDLDVEIRSAFKDDNTRLNPIKEVKSGNADIGIMGVDILFEYDRSDSIRLLMPIFQKSSSAYFMLESLDFNDLSDLLKHKVYRFENTYNQVELFALLKKEGINKNEIIFVKDKYNYDLLFNKEIDIFPAYKHDLLFVAKQKGLKVKYIQPYDYGINFYGDSIFVSKDKLFKNKSKYEKFIKATKLGWNYALENKNEIINMIEKDLRRTVKIENFKEFLSSEADEIEKVMIYPTVEIGHLNKERVKLLYSYMLDMKLVSKPYKAKDLIFDFETYRLERKKGINIFIIILLVIFVFIIFISLLHLNMFRTVIKIKTKNLVLITKELNEKYTEIQHFYDISPIGVCLINKEKKIINYNNKFLEITNISNTTEKYNKELENLIEEFSINIDEVISKKQKIEKIEKVKNKKISDNDFVYLKYSFDPILFKNDDINRISIIAEDITSFKKYEDQLNKDKDKLENVNEIKRNIISNMSHELRTPLNAVLGFTKLLQKQENDETKIDFLNTIYTSGERVLEIVNNMLLMKDLENNESNEGKKIFEISNLVDDLNKHFKEDIKIYNIDFNSKIDKNIPKYLFGYKVSILIILINLLKNAFKFSERGNVFLLINFEKGKRQHSLKITIKDNGIGISEDKLDKIFDSFYQEEYFLTKKFSGAGLGLPVVKLLISKINGKLEVFSEKNVGTKIDLEIPVEIIKNNEYRIINTSFDKKSNLNDINIIVIEDENASRFLMKILLEDKCKRVETFQTGDELLKLDKLESCDVFIIDIQLPNMNGFEIIKILKDRKIKAKMIAISSFGGDDIKQKAFDFGFDIFYRKPIIEKDFLNILNNLFQ